MEKVGGQCFVGQHTMSKSVYRSGIDSRNEGRVSGVTVLSSRRNTKFHFWEAVSGRCMDRTSRRW